MRLGLLRVPGTGRCETSEKGQRTATHVKKALPQWILPFVQFFMTLLGLAKVKGILSAVYQKEIGADLK